MGTAPREVTSMPSACRSSRASPLRNSPQTLWRGVGSRSIIVTLRPFRASAIEAAHPATPPPTMRTSPCTGIRFSVAGLIESSLFRSSTLDVSERYCKIHVAVPVEKQRDLEPPELARVYWETCLCSGIPYFSLDAATTSLKSLCTNRHLGACKELAGSSCTDSLMRIVGRSTPCPGF